MGTASTTKFIKNSAGNLAEEAALTTTAGAGDAQKIPALNADGILDPTIVNGTVTSAGSGDAAKVVQLDGAGKLDITVLPTGIAADTAIVTASEALADGDLVNVWDNAGAFRVRKADASASGKEAHGFVKAVVANGAPATVYFEGSNDHVSGLTPGVQFLSATTPGLATATAPSGSGKVVQRVGFAVAAAALNFQSAVPITLA